MRKREPKQKKEQARNPPVGGQENGKSLGCALALLSDTGRVRETNQDSVFALVQERICAAGVQTLGLFMIADGMGGHVGGERASQLAIWTASQNLLREVVLPYADPAGDGWRATPITEAIEQAFQEAHRRVQREVPGGATTLTVALLMGQRVYVGHAGDCRLYWRHQETLTPLTREHSILSRMIELGQVAADNSAPAHNDPRRNALYRAVGQPGDLEIDLFSHALGAGDGLLMCCDGLWASVSDQEMSAIILQADSPAVACRRLVDLANARGGLDNITVLLFDPIG